ncbi:MAG: co-chaperone GroES [Acidobacteria bacterium]|nr:co-chaperone GroES [Acidobacteriota bacterium]
MHVRPLHDRILVQRSKEDEGEQQIGGIIIPDSAKEKPQRGTVIAAGNGKVRDDGDRVKLDVKAGDTILFGKYSGQEIKLDGVEYLIMKEDEVLAAIDDVGGRAGAAKTPTAKAAPARAATAKAKAATRKGR